MTAEPGAVRIPSNGLVDFDQQIADIKREIAAKNPARILVFIHGGLNTFGAGLQRVHDAAKEVECWNAKNPNDTVYLIFINWHSRFVTWYDRLFRIRDGRAAPLSAWLTAPIMFVADLGRAVARLPVTMFTEGRSSVTNLVGARAVARPPSGWDNVNGDARYQRSSSELLVSAVTHVIPGVIRPATMILADSVLYDSYRMMLRRIDMLFRTEADYTAAANRASPGSNGAVTKLMEMLDEQEGAELVLMGHSLGCIAINEIIRRNPKHQVKDIVYMAAACSAKDFYDTVPPYLKEHTCTNFYSLCLHPFADSDEAIGLSALPRGSLLEWLDSFAIQVKTPLDLTFGKWNNAQQALPLFQDLSTQVRQRVHIKGFPVVEDKYPQAHGDFDDFPFWNPKFWDPSCFAVIDRYR